MDNQVKTQARMSIWPKWLRPERPAKPPGGTHVAPVARSIGSGKYVSSQGLTHGDPPANKKATMRTSILSSLAEQVSSRPTHASEMRFCKTWQIPQHKHGASTPTGGSPFWSNKYHQISQHMATMASQSSTSLICTEPEMSRRYNTCNIERWRRWTCQGSNFEPWHVHLLHLSMLHV